MQRCCFYCLLHVLLLLHLQLQLLELVLLLWLLLLLLLLLLLFQAFISKGSVGNGAMRMSRPARLGLSWKLQTV